MTDAAVANGFHNLWQRLITGLVLAGVALGALFAGAGSFWLLTALLAVAMMAEWAGLMKVTGWKAWLGIALIAALMLFAHPLYRTIDMITLYALLGGTMVSGLFTVSHKIGSGLLYIGLACLAIIFLRDQAGLNVTLWTLAMVWATDVGAYFSGKTIGGPKLASQFSPNKSWAGLIGGILCAMAVSLGFTLQSDLPWPIIPLAAGLAIVAQLGDLLESWLKRRADVKDSSTLFPGHGGALDRLDGLLPVAIGVASLSAAGALR